MRRLIITAGLPRSGKTTWAHQQLGAAIVNPDSIRLALHGTRFLDKAEPFVWAIAYAMVEALFLAGHGVVIVDATNVTQKRRDPWAALADRLLAEFEVHVVDTSPNVCIQRAKVNSDFEIISVIDRMAAQWDLPAAWKT